MHIAIIGCGFVADYYASTLSAHPHLILLGGADQNQDRVATFSKTYAVRGYESVQELLADANVEIVLNLTNPRSHFEVSKACLEAGKHVYSEKPLAMTVAESKALVALARSKGLQISCAPCSVLSETAQTLWKALREKTIGDVRLVYAEMDDGMIHKMPYHLWKSASGFPWPFKDEFEVGCTLEHAGYYINWLTAFFGPAETVTAFSSHLIPNKVPDVNLTPPNTPDFSVACIQFKNGVVARLTCGIVAPHDHSLRIIGDEGVLGIKDCWYYSSPVYLQRLVKIRRKVFMNPIKTKYKLVRKPPKFDYKGAQQMDFSRGVAEMSRAISERRRSRLDADISLHNNELAIAIQNAKASSGTYRMTTSFQPVLPMDWAI